MPDINLVKRDFSHFNEREFCEDISNMNWDRICDLNENDPDLSMKNFFDAITYKLDE